MSRVASLAACTIGACSTVWAAAQEHLFYGGDFNGINGLACERNTQVSDARTYDDVIVRAPALVSGIWGNHLSYGLVSSRAYGEIRIGVRPGDGGRLVAAGEGRAVYRYTGRGSSLTEYQCFVSLKPALLLMPGRYWVTVCPIGDGFGRAFVSATSGQDRGPNSEDPNPRPTGEPIANGNSYFDSRTFGMSWLPTYEVLDGAYVWDFSFGIGPYARDRIRASAFRLVHGTLVGGDLASVTESDNRYLVIQQTTAPAPGTPNIRVLWRAKVEFDRIDELRFTFESKVNNSPVGWTRLMLDLYNFAGARWERIAEVPAEPNDRTIDVLIAGDAERFVEPLTRRMLAYSSWHDQIAALQSWYARIDLVRWTVRRVY